MQARLARDYRFKCVGGTSAGAIAAAACVAAEFGRQSGAKPDAFERLAELPRLLGDPVPDGSGSKLLHLFQPTPALRDHFAVLLLVIPIVRAVTALHGLRAVGGGVLVLVLWLLALSVAARTTAARVAQHGGAMTGAWPPLAGGLALVGLVSIWGLCSGRTLNAQPQSEGLTEWLTVYLNGLAGVGPDDRPLTFGDLWAGQRLRSISKASTRPTPSIPSWRRARRKAAFICPPTMRPAWRVFGPSRRTANPAG